MPSREPFEVLATGPDGEGWRLRLRIPDGTPLCDGHFPGHPIVPGIAHLAWVERAMADQCGRPVLLRGVRAFRLRKPVHPGDELELQLRPHGQEAGESFAFGLKRSGEAVSDGRVEAAGEIPAAEPEAERSASVGSPSPDPALESLIPHRGPMRLLRKLLEVGEETILCEAVVPAGSPLARDGRAPGWLAIEAAAQAAAALEALARRDQDPGPRLGYLVGVREARIESPDLPVEIPFRVALRAQGAAPPLAVYEAQAELNGTCLLTATLSTYVPPG